MRSPTALSSGASRLVALIGLVLLVANLPAWAPAFPAPGLDPSWVMALQYGHDQGWQWGTDVVFTYGPLAFLYTKTYDPLTYDIALAVWVFLALSAGLGLVAAAGRAGVLATTVAVLGLMVAFDSPDVFFMGLPLLLTVVWCAEGGLLRTVALACLLVALALVTDIKLSALPLCLLAVVLVDAGRIVGRGLPIFTPGYLLAGLALWMAAGQDLGNLPAYLINTFEVIRGYDSAMQVSGSRGDTLFYLGTALVAVVLFGWGLCSGRSGAPRHRRIILALMALASLQVSFKAGFVRHDLHSLLSWLALCAVCSSLLLLPWARPTRRAAYGLALLLPFVAAFSYARNLHRGAGLPYSVAFGPLTPERLRGETTAALKDFSAEQRAAYDAARSAALSKIAADSGFPKVDGTVDVMPSDQARLLAAGDRYTPRPVFQDYVAYTPRLADLNGRFFRSDRAPASVLFNTSSVDNRYPASIDGVSWTALLDRYEPLRVEGKYLVLGRRPAPAATALLPPVSREVSFGTAVPLWTPPDAPAVWATVQLRETLLGKLVHILWKPPVVEMEVIGTADHGRAYRLVPGSGEAGFMLSPSVGTSMDFLSLYVTDPAASGLPKVAQIRFQIPRWAEALYQPQIGVSLSVMKLPPMIQNPELAKLLEPDGRIGIWRRLAETSPTAIVQDDDLFAHAPTRMSIAAGTARRISVQFGLKDDCWRGAGDVHGVIFKVSAEGPGGVHELWSRTLQPKTIAADRGRQTATVSLQPGDTRLIFETLPLDGQTQWAWSYWGDISFLHGPDPG